MADNFTARLTIFKAGTKSQSVAVLDVTLSTERHSLTYAVPNHQPSDLTLPSDPGYVVTLTITTASGVITPLVWTAESFTGIDANDPLKSSFDNSKVSLSFTQRCLLSETGYATWALLLTSGAFPAIQYRLGTAETLDYPNDTEKPLDLNPNAISFSLKDRDDDVHGNFLGEISAGAVVAKVRPSGDLAYQALSVKLKPDLQLGNGLSISSNDKQVTVWQSCSYDIASNRRKIPMGLDGIQSSRVVDCWNANIARRYYEGLEINHGFTFLPELTLRDGSAPLWNATLRVTDSGGLPSAKDRTWIRQDNIDEYPTFEPSTVATSGTCVTKVMGIRIASIQTPPTPQQASVFAELRGFRRRDGKPVRLDLLTLASPPYNESDTTAWNLNITGYVRTDVISEQFVFTDKDGKNPTTVAEQVVRAGGFALHLLPQVVQPPPNSDKVKAYVLNITAEFGITRPRPAKGPVMPMISISITTLDGKPATLPIFDAAPAGEDDRNVDQYSQLNIGTPSQNADPNNTPGIREYLNEIYYNMQRDSSVVFRRPSDQPVPVADGQWSLQYREQSSAAEKQIAGKPYVSMQLWFEPIDGTAKNTESVFVFSRNPFSFADVHYHPLMSGQSNTGTAVADWNSVSNEWKILQLNGAPSYMVLPPQVVGEENVKSGTVFPHGLNDGQPTVTAVGSPTVITYASNTQTKAVKLPWDLQRLMTDASLNVSRIDYEMLYGMVASTVADHMRLTEVATLYGDLLGEFPQLSVPKDTDADYKTRLYYLKARLHWSRIHREYRSRLGVYAVQDGSSADPESFTDTANTAAWLRLNDTTGLDMSLGGAPVPMQDYIRPSELSTDYINQDSFRGGALNGIEDLNLFRLVVNSRTTGKGNAAVVNPRFSALGGFGTTRGSFNNKQSTLINTISMGRTVNYTVEQVGRIACYWNHAKHVIVYERTVVPSRQFYGDQQAVAFRGIPLVRKVEEYVEFVQPERIFAEETAVPQTAFARGFKCGERVRISVDGAWGIVVPGQGWKIPLWNPTADSVVYPKPEFYLETATPEQTLDSTVQRPTFLTADALLTNPEEVYFYTSYVETADNTDLWQPVETVDCVGYPLIGPDTDVYNGDGDLNKAPLPEFSTPPGWEPVTFHIASPAAGVNVTSGVIDSATPMAAQLSSVTVNRSNRPKATTVRTLLSGSANATALSNYSGLTTPLAAIPQTFANMQAAVKAEIAAPNTAKTKQTLADSFNSLANASTDIPKQLSTAASDMATNFIKPYTDAATNLKAKITANAASVTTVVNGVVADLKNPSSNPRIVAAHKQFQQTLDGINRDAHQWTVKNDEQLTALIRRWSDAVDSVLAAYAVPLNTPIGTLSPLRNLTIAFKKFKKTVSTIHADANTVLSGNLGTNPSLKKAQDFATELLGKARVWDGQFDGALSQLTQGLTHLQHESSGLDPSLSLLAFHTIGIAGQIKTVVDSAFQAVSLQSPASQVAASELMQALAPAIKAVGDLNDALNTIDGNISNHLNDVGRILDESVFDLLQQTDVAKLYTKSIADQKTLIVDYCTNPDKLLNPIVLQAYGKLAGATSDALTNFGTLLAKWIGDQVPILFNALAPAFLQLQGLAQSVDNLVNFNPLQTQLQQLSNQMRGWVQQAGEYVDQYVRQPLMAEYEALTPTGDRAIRVLRAFGAPPQVPNLDMQPAVVGFLYDGVAKQVPITPLLARANQAGQILNALGVHLPTIALGQALIPAALKNFKLTDVLPNFAGLRMPGIFAGIKLPDIDERNVTVTHGWEPQTRRAWLQADVNIPFTQRMVVFNAGFISFVLTDATFAAQSRIQNNGTAVQQSTHGSITGTWNVEVSDSNALISFASTALAFDDHGKFQFLFRPDHLTLSDALKAITALVQSFSDPDSGFSYGATPTGVKCAFALPVPDTAALTSGFTGLKFSTSLALDFSKGFKVILAIGVSSKDRPFNLAIFILGGCGYLTAGVAYDISAGHFDTPALEMAIGCSGSLAIALGPISGGIYAQFAIELRNNGGGFTAGAFFQITGHVSICGILSVDIVFRLEASYGSGVMIASGHFSITIKLFMFSFSVSRDVSMQMGSSGQKSVRLDAPQIHPAAPRTLVAALERPDGDMKFPRGLEDAFFAAPAADQNCAQRYLALLL